MDDPLKDFVSTEIRTYRIKIGQLIASSLSGFIAGLAIASVIWYLALVAMR